jgi:hypothetical protein
MDPASIVLLAILALRVGWGVVQHIQRRWRGQANRAR